MTVLAELGGWQVSRAIQGVSSDMTYGVTTVLLPAKRAMRVEASILYHHDHDLRSRIRNGAFGEPNTSSADKAEEELILEVGVLGAVA